MTGARGDRKRNMNAVANSGLPGADEAVELRNIPKSRDERSEQEVGHRRCLFGWEPQSLSDLDQPRGVELAADVNVGDLAPARRNPCEHGSAEPGAGCR